MTIAELRTARYAEPFRPFRLLLAGPTRSGEGRAVLVRQPNVIAWSERGQTIVVIGEQGTEIFDLGQVTELVVEPGPGAPGEGGAR
jgi:hypothetical protein